MPRQSYTVLAVLREEALCQAGENVFRITVRQGAPGAPTGAILWAQPPARPVPYLTGATLSIDPCLVTMDGAS